MVHFCFYYKYLQLFFCACLTLPLQCHSVYFEELANLTSSQQRALEKFRVEFENTPLHNHELLQRFDKDLTVARFLRAKNYRVRDALTAIKETMDWRKKNKIDTIDEDDFSDIDDYTIYTDGVDKQGRVILESNFGAWEMRKAVLAGKMNRLQRASTQAFEMASRKVREFQKEGKNITQWVILSNLEGFSIIETACPACLPYYLNFVNTYEKHYPFTAGHVLFVNTPSSFETILALLRPIMNIQSRRIMKVFGENEKQWRPYLEQYFDYDQIGTSFGGKKVRKSKNL